MYRSLWGGFARLMSPENVARIEEIADIGRALFPLQMSIFDSVTRGINPAGARPVNSYTDDEYRAVLQEIQDTHRRCLREGRERRAASTGDSWQTQVPLDEAAGKVGWQQRAIDGVREIYGCDVTEEIPAMEHLKTCLCKAKQATITAEKRVQQLTTSLANAKIQRGEVRKILRVNGQPARNTQSSALAAVEALENLAKATEEELTEASREGDECKQHLYVLQQSWTRAVGLTSSIVPLCNICLQRGVNVVCVPCGHTYCDQCAAGVGKQPNASQYALVPCHVCRSTVRIKQKLFFS